VKAREQPATAASWPCSRRSHLAFLRLGRESSCSIRRCRVACSQAEWIKEAVDVVVWVWMRVTASQFTGDSLTVTGLHFLIEKNLGLTSKPKPIPNFTGTEDLPSK